MPLKKDQIEHLTQQIYQSLLSNKLIRVVSNERAILKTIRDILLVDAQTEVDLLDQASKMMDQFKAQIQSGQIEYDKMYGMIKKQLAKDKKFTF